MEYIKCPKCDGDGELECPKCGGSSFAHSIKATTNEMFGIDEEEQCTRCHDKFVVQCNECGGTGEVRKARLEELDDISILTEDTIESYNYEDEDDYEDGDDDDDEDDNDENEDEDEDDLETTSAKIVHQTLSRKYGSEIVELVIENSLSSEVIKYSRLDSVELERHFLYYFLPISIEILKGKIEIAEVEIDQIEKLLSLYSNVIYWSEREKHLEFAVSKHQEIAKWSNQLLKLNLFLMNNN